MDIRELGVLQIDALREVANMGAGHAATALSQLVGCRILVEVPRIRVVPIEEVGELTGDAGEVVAAVMLQVLGDLTGRAIQVFPGRTAAGIASILLHQDLEFPADFGELERSAITEVGNIVTGAYLNALSDFMGMLLLTSVPTLAIDSAGAVLTSSQLSYREDIDDAVVCIDTRFATGADGQPLTGHFLLMPDPASLQVILQALRLA